MTTEKKTSLFQQTHIQTDSIPLQIHHILQYVFFLWSRSKFFCSQLQDILNKVLESIPNRMINNFL